MSVYLIDSIAENLSTLLAYMHIIQKKILAKIEIAMNLW